MDQTYGATAPNQTLDWIDNASLSDRFPQREPPPWAVPSDWTIAASIDGAMNGKFVVYKNGSTHQVMIVAMGTDGNGDLQGWLSNVQSFALQQWKESSVKKEVFDAANAALGDVSGTQLIVGGDSKGGALARSANHHRQSTFQS